MNNQDLKISPNATKAPRIKTVALPDQLEEDNVYLEMSIREIELAPEGMALGLNDVLIASVAPVVKDANGSGAHVVASKELQGST